MSDDVWHDYALTVGMPHMVPYKLSEVELLKWLGAYQWDSIARALGVPSARITSADGARLYASFLGIELGFPRVRPPDAINAIGEGTRLSLRNRVQFYARRFVEGLWVFDKEPIAPSVTEAVRGKRDLDALDRPWAYMVNAFVAPAGSASSLKVLEPTLAADVVLPSMDDPPAGIAMHREVQATGRVEPAEVAGMIALPDRSGAPFVYEISPESDINGAGLLYFARYVAIMNQGERRLLCERQPRPVSAALVEHLATEYRVIHYFMNADAFDKVQVYVRGALLPRSEHDRRLVTRFGFWIDLYRASDGVWMATSFVRKRLEVPARLKSLTTELDRWLLALRGQGA